jgi:hypothetical protein
LLLSFLLNLWLPVQADKLTTDHVLLIHSKEDLPALTPAMDIKFATIVLRKPEIAPPQPLPLLSLAHQKAQLRNLPSVLADIPAETIMIKLVEPVNTAAQTVFAVNKTLLLLNVALHGPAISRLL